MHSPQVMLVPFDTEKLLYLHAEYYCLLAEGIFLCKNSILSSSLVSIVLVSVPSLSIPCFIEQSLLGPFQLVICGLPQLSFIKFPHCLCTQRNPSLIVVINVYHICTIFYFNQQTSHVVMKCMLYYLWPNNAVVCNNMPS